MARSVKLAGWPDNRLQRTARGAAAHLGSLAG
jgi:hypothetical protein